MFISKKKIDQHVTMSSFDKNTTEYTTNIYIEDVE